MILSAGMVIIREEQGKRLFLLLRAYRYWDFPKGEVGTREDPFDAARREVREETGLSELSFPWGRVYRETEPYRSGGGYKIARYYLAETSQRNVVMSVNPELGRPEHDEYRWLEAPAAKQLLGPRPRAILAWAVEVSGTA